jgi:phospholipid/cholesterol/gamma-HCH transport system permease protein
MSTSVEVSPGASAELSPAEPTPSIAARIRQRLESLGALAVMTGKVFSRAVRPPYDWGALV